MYTAKAICKILGERHGINPKYLEFRFKNKFVCGMRDKAYTKFDMDLLERQVHWDYMKADWEEDRNSYSSIFYGM